MQRHIINVSKRGKVRLPYWTALGRFVSLYATVEATMFLVLCNYAKVTPFVGRAIFSGVKSELAAQHIKRILEAKKKEKSIEYRHLCFLFDQLGNINSTRNEIIHYGSIFTNDDENMYVTNAPKALTREKIYKFPISDKILDAMTEDCKFIVLALRAHHLIKNPEKLSPDWKAPENAWLYKRVVDQLKKPKKSVRKGHHQKSRHRDPPKASHP